MADIVIDDARGEDIPALVALLGELFSIEADFQPDPARQTRGLRLLLQQPPQRAAIKVARAGEQVIGMVSAQLVISTAQGAASAWLEDMVVSARYRGEGVGKSLLQEITMWAQAQGASRAQLLVDTDNAPALAYYKHLGWQATQLQARRRLL